MLKIKDVAIALCDVEETYWTEFIDTNKITIKLSKKDKRPLSLILPGVYAEMLKRQGYSAEHVAKIVSASRIRNYVKNKIVGRFSQRTINRFETVINNKEASNELLNFYKEKYGDKRGTEIFFLCWLAYREKYLLDNGTVNKNCALHFSAKGV